MYLSGNKGIGNYLGRYTQGSSGGYSGLGNIWGESKAAPKSPSQIIKEARESAKKAPKKPSKSAAPDSVSEPNPITDINQTLPPSVADDENTVVLKDPEDFIPKQKPVLNAIEAMKILTRPAGARGGEQQRIKGIVYWTPQGPKYSQKPVSSGNTAERVHPPLIKLKPNVKVVRDLPVVPGLQPVEVPQLPKEVAAKMQATTKTQPKTLKGYFGEMAFGKGLIILVVLCLIVLIVYGYNKA